MGSTFRPGLETLRDGKPESTRPRNCVAWAGGSLIVGRLPPADTFALAARRTIPGYDSRNCLCPQRRSF